MANSRTSSSFNPQAFLFIGFVCLAYWLTTTPCAAGSVTNAYVNYDGEEYHLNLAMRIDSPVPAVWKTLTDYKQLKQLSTSIQKSQIVQKDDNNTRIKVIHKGCIVFFCRKITRLQDIRELGQGYLMVKEVAGKSDFTSGYTLWHVIPQKQSSQVTISARLKPGFWIPPFLGPWLFQKKLLQQGQELITNLEKLNTHELPSQ